MINGVNLNSESIHKNLILSSHKMAETKANMQQNNKFTTFTSIGSDSKEVSNCFNQATSMTLNDLKKGMMHTAHVRLQNNGWNYENFCRLYKSTTTNNNNNTYYNYNNNKNIKVANDEHVTAQILEKTKTCIPIKQNDQEHAYAKLKQNYSESGSGESSRSSPHDDDDDDDGDDDEEETEDSTDTVDLQQKDKNLRTDISLMSHLKYLKKYRLLKREHEEEMHIDVETVPQEEELKNEVNLNYKKDNEALLETEMTPDHHARRPMNAFLIFCKRHRAIVKDRYKNLENRAITKILGDWWASLEANDKECFTNLAQQNKDAFFSANPNFKWYKLPAPPLRTLRANSSDNMQEYNTHDDDDSQNNFFKLADETQMGDLSALLTYNEKRKQKYMQNDQVALQQALGETTQFLNKHIQPVKRSFADVELEETLPKKTSRSCKGKKYQELMQSGQIAASVKKAKVSLPKQQISMQHHQQLNEVKMQSETNEVYQQVELMNKQQQHQQQQQQLENSTVFDLEEKIKELPALSLDTYLQRKRNVKKKRSKINAKKSNSSQLNAKTTKTKKTKIIIENNNNNNNKNNNIIVNNNQTTNNIECNNLVRTVVVGSQKRKARKESITRRDVNSLENENVTAVLPMSSTCYNSIKGNFFFDDTLTTRNANIAHSMIFNENLNKAIPPTSDLLILAEVAEKTSCY